MRKIFLFLLLVTAPLYAHESTDSDLVALEDLVQIELVALNAKVKALESRIELMGSDTVLNHMLSRFIVIETELEILRSTLSGECIHKYEIARKAKLISENLEVAHPGMGATDVLYLTNLITDSAKPCE